MRHYIRLNMHNQLRTIRDCDFRPLDEPGAYQCPFCGYTVYNITVLPIRKNCEVRTRWALGDRVSYYLRRCGITKEGWHAWMVYLSPYEERKKESECSGCKKRQEKLNRFGDWWLLRWWSFRGWLTTWTCPR